MKVELQPEKEEKEECGEDPQKGRRVREGSGTPLNHKWERYRSRNKHAPLQSHFRNKLADAIFSILWRYLSQSQLYEQSLKTNLRL